MQQNRSPSIIQTDCFDSKERLDESGPGPYILIVRCTNIAQQAHEAKRTIR
jgi:hypothetical protein